MADYLKCLHKLVLKILFYKSLSLYYKHGSSLMQSVIQGLGVVAVMECMIGVQST